jgi:hypothetical protein
MNNIPTNLDEALDFLVKVNNYDSAIRFLKSTDEDSFVSEQHHSTGMALRNEWGLWEKESELSKWFNNIGIYHADDMSSIIMTSFHRLINTKDIDLESQVKHYIDYWDDVDPLVNKGFYNFKEDDI